LEFVKARDHFAIPLPASSALERLALAYLDAS
jgi:hypothetical protein